MDIQTFSNDYTTNAPSETQSPSTISDDISAAATTTITTNPDHYYNYFSINTLITSLKTPTNQITCLALFNTTCLYATSLNQIFVFDLTNNHSMIDTFHCHDSSSGFVKSITFTNHNIFTAHQDCKIRVWKQTLPSKRHRLVSTLPTVKDRLYRCISPNNYLQIRRHKKHLWVEHVDTVSGLAVNCNDGLLFSVSWDKSFKIWRMSDFRCLQSVIAHADAVNAVVCSANGTVYTASADGQIKVWEGVVNENGDTKYKLANTLEKHKSSVNALALSNDGASLFSGGCDRLISVWERDKFTDHQMSFAFPLVGHEGAVLCLIYVHGLLISGSSDRTVRIWGRSSGIHGYCCMGVLEGHSKPVKSLAAVSSYGVVSVYSGSLDGDIKVWQLNNLNELRHKSLDSSN